MHAVITGDIVHSRGLAPELWLEPLKVLLNRYGAPPKAWEVYRGDSFQLLLADPRDALRAAMRIKAQLKQHKTLDVRMGIGIGRVGYHAERITESNGQAFVHSGELLEQLKSEKRNLAIRSPWEALNEELNLGIRLGLMAMDEWTPASAKLVALRLDDPERKQADLASALGIAQSSVSERQTRAHFEEIMLLEARFRTLIDQRIAAIPSSSTKDASGKKEHP